ncbi:MAG: carboxypeptidase regulatory-like domain-containing protein [Bryobacteraceae bacterium]
MSGFSIRRVGALAIFLLAASAAFAQSGNSVISGSVKDASGLAIPAAKIKIANRDSGVQVETVTNEEGLYRFAALVPGGYQLDVAADGFDRVSRGPVTLQISQTLALDFTLQVGAQSQTVQVTEAAPLVESQSSNVGQAVTRQMLEGLPLPNRAASSLVALAPGVVMIDSGSGTAENYPVFSVAGGRARNQNFVMDGGNVSNAVGLTRPQQLTTLPVDAMQEFRVIANNYSAEYGHSTGGIVTMSTRSGTNQYHGSVFESLQNTVFNARNFFAANRAPIRLNQYGLTLGGPIRKDKTFFFVSWEQTRQLTSQTILSTVPTLLNRQGDFSDLRNSSGAPITIFDPSTGTGTARQAFANNQIPSFRLDAVALAALNYFPTPNRPGTITNANNYTGNSRDLLNRNIVLGRLDHQIRTNDLLSARYYINDANTNLSGTYGKPAADPTADLTDVRVQSLLVAETHIFNPSVSNDFRATYLRRKFIDTRPGAGENLAGAIGLKGVSTAAFPAFTIPGYATLGNPTAVARFQTPILDKQIIDAVTWQHGRHAFKFGGEFRAGANDEIRDRSSAGAFTFSPLITGFNGTGGNGLASFLLGQTNSAAIQVSDKIPSRASYFGFYFQDDWRVTDRLTVNAGIRWEVELPRRVVDNKMNSFDPLAINPVSGTPGVVTFAGVNGVSERAFQTDWNNFGPRLGFAYRIPGKTDTVIRGGAGIFYGPTVSNTIGDVASLGFSTAASYTTAQAANAIVFPLQSGVPAYTRPALNSAFGAVPVGTSPNTAISFFNPKQVAPVSYQYNLDIQREVIRDLLLEVGYIGNVSHHLTANDFSLNQVPANRLITANTQALRPFPQFTNVTWLNPSIGNSTYHGGFIRAEKRMSHGLSFLAHYTLSKFIDDVESSNEYGTSGSYMDAYNRQLDKGLSGSDLPHHVVVTLLYEVPKFRGNRIVNGTLGGWKIGVLETYQSGPVFTVTTASNTTNAFPAGTLRPNVSGNPSLPSDQRTISRWFNTSLFSQPAALAFGNAPRSLLRGAPIVTTDATFEKSFSLTERTKFDLRGEFYNLFNHAIFNTPGSVFGAADFGAVTSTRPPRTVQLAARLSF